MKKKFDISMRPQIESGEYKVVTADDHPVDACYEMIIRLHELNLL